MGGRTDGSVGAQHCEICERTPRVLWRGHTEATPDNGSKLMLLLAVDPGTRVAVIEDGES